MFLVKAFKPILLDLAATIFFLAVFWSSGNIFVATAAGIAAGIARVSYLKLAGHAITPMQWLALALVVVFGGTTLVTHNPHFVMIKPTLVFFAVGAVMLTTDWLKPYLPAFVADHVSETEIALLARSWGVLLIFLGIANGAAAFFLAPKPWALYAAAVPTACQIAGAIATYGALRFLVNRARRSRAATQTP